ncbi:MAG: hypothetical protein AVDCRST_MAG31-2643, partial [uncultured Sphingomonas sp.]
ADRRIHRRPPRGLVPGGVQRHQGVHRQLRRGAGQRAEGYGCHRHLPQARRDRDRVLRARRHGGHQGRPGQEGRPRGRRQDRLGSDEGRQGKRRLRPQEQGAGVGIGHPAGIRDRGHAPPAGGAGQRVL